ncbi:MAG: formyltetrahydrofolate deformylase [Candidatus Marinimicrobia bacterium]|nr:formyltetrahydrofolate deformylase [Candidatus Neomarinimicrobiota bacterium]
MSDKNLTAVLLLSCPDRVGIVARISHFIFERGGNILDLDEHVDIEENIFFTRISWDMKDFTIPASELEQAFMPLAKEFHAKWDIHFLEEKPKAAIFVSKYAHCLQEILWRYSLGEFNVEIPLIISNHPDLESLAEEYGISYHVFPINKNNKKEQEQKELDLMEEHEIDFIVLARYMQILSSDFVDAYHNRIINIHHSFLPAFIGGNPYEQAYKRGVKIIGATSHYVTEKLDEGPIIEQDVVRISHKDTIEDLKYKGRDLERLVLVQAFNYHCEQRILVYKNKTVVFD